jgi:hypothetical protein
MHLFTRQATLRPEHRQDGLAHAVEMAQFVSKKTGLDVVPWATVYGAPLGTVSWSGVVESQAAMGAAQEKLLSDATFGKKVAAASDFFVATPEDAIGEIVTASNPGGGAHSYASITIAECAGGKIAPAMAWGVEMTQFVAKTTGLDATFVRGIYGPFSTVVWITLADTLEQVDAADAALGSDPSYLERLGDTGELFRPGSASRRLIRRLA